MEKDYKYYGVLTKNGHISKRYYIPILYGIKAKSAKQAAKIARNIPRVKHNHKDAILNVSEISYDVFLLINELNKKDTYLQCHSKHEANFYDFSDRIVEDPHYLESHKKSKKEKQCKQLYYKKTKIKNPKKFFGFHDCYMEDLVC